MRKASRRTSASLVMLPESAISTSAWSGGLSHKTRAIRVTTSRGEIWSGTGAIDGPVEPPGAAAPAAGRKRGGGGGHRGAGGAPGARAPGAPPEPFCGSPGGAREPPAAAGDAQSRRPGRCARVDFARQVIAGVACEEQGRGEENE